VHQLVAKGLRTVILACALAVGASVAGAQTTPPSLDDDASEASRYAILYDGLWVMGSDAVPERVDTAKAAVAAKPDSADAHLRLGLALRWEDPDAEPQAQQEYETALRLDPALPRAYALLGELQSHRGDEAGVLKTYQAWLALAPNDAKAHLSYAVALGRVGRMPEARAELERSLALKPSPAGYVLRTMMTPDAPHEAILADFDKALAVGGDEARVYRWRARTQRGWGQLDAALADVNRALAYAPRSLHLRQLRAQINADAGHYVLAILELNDLIAQQPGWPDMLNDRCWTRGRAGIQLDLALADCDTALSGQPTQPDGLDSRGFIKLRLNDLPGAIADYDAALKEDPELATSLFGRGVAKRANGDKAGGDADLAKARALDPGIDQRFAGFGVTP
jgi:tetratricopeptide (TPR) repeat protein